ncbi:MAG: hypothetical protein LUD27_00730 [Clostridia bacterium]|nr:hypothetical protein [Clostridia bacterium]
MRYRRPALQIYGWSEMYYKLIEIAEGCSYVHWYENNDEETLLNCFDGDSDEEEEFKIAFSEMEGKAYRLQEQMDRMIDDNYGVDMEQYFNDCTVALLGNRYNLVGYDYYEEDYQSLTQYEQELADEGAQERLMRKTKKEIISTISQCIGLLLAFYDILQDYDVLSLTMDVLKGENTEFLDNIKKLFKLHAKMCEGDRMAEREFNRIVEEMPDKCWLY